MDLTEYAYSNGIIATKALSKDEQKHLGQFMTPVQVARFMANRCLNNINLQNIRILDPAAGTGTLIAAIVEELLNDEHVPKSIKIIIYEIDARLIPFLKKLANMMRRKALEYNVSLTVSINNCDFLLSPISLSDKPIADVIIANLPYFKINKTDPRSLAHPEAVYGQPNIYGLFMSACASILSKEGRWCFITPRSWTNGMYFGAVRKQLFEYLSIEAIHLFESRKSHFIDDKILQEAMITWAKLKTESKTDILISRSIGSNDLDKIQTNKVSLREVISQDSVHEISIPGNNSGNTICNWENTLISNNLNVSTGPVIGYRSVKYLRQKKSKNTVPLIWMNNIDSMSISWPIKRKSEYIIYNKETSWMLVPNKNLVLLRRFSPNESDQRIVAVPYLANTLPGEVIGLENHLNYIYRPNGEMTIEEVKGLAAYLNSYVIDQYIRTKSGNTQINANDLLKMPMPPINLLVELGRNININATLDLLNCIVERILGIEIKEAIAV
ncbi:MAG: N-6 DNA methylase [Bacteroidales bacterium]